MIWTGLAITLCMGVSVHGDDIKVDPRLLPPPALGRMEFRKDIQPIFERACIRCHASGRRRQGGFYRQMFRLDMGRDAALETEGVIVPGKSEDSTLIHHVSWLKHPTNGGFLRDPMPPTDKDRLSAAEIGKLRAWIDQGAHWHGMTLEAPKGYRLVSALVKEPFPTDAGEAAWREFVRKHEMPGLKASLIVAEKKAKMLLHGEALQPKKNGLGIQLYIPPHYRKVRVFLPDLMNARVEVRIRDVKTHPGLELWTKGLFHLAFEGKPVWTHEGNGTGVLSPELEVTYDGHPVLDVRVLTGHERPAGVSNILVLTSLARKK